MLGRFIAKRFGLVSKPRPSQVGAAAAQIALTATLPEVDCIVAERATARAANHPKVIAREF